MRKQNVPRSIFKPLAYRAGRDARGRISVRHRGGRHKRKYRIIDFLRDKKDIPARVESIEYDPNRGADIALLVYEDGEKRYILAPQNLNIHDKIVTGEHADIAVGNALPLKNIPIGTFIHNLELVPGKGGQIARGAGNYAAIMGRDGDYVKVKLPSGEIRLINKECYATIGMLSNQDLKHRKLKKAGDSRHRGRRPSVRGVAMDPSSHPHGGGEGRSGIGMPSPKSPWGKKTLGYKTKRKKKKGNRFVVQGRKK